MSKPSFRKFRRFPARELDRVQTGPARIMARLFRCLDYKGYLSDLIADPVSTLSDLTRQYTLPLRKTDELSCVSIVIATRNNADTLEGAVRSLQRQTYQNIEIIIIDDASEDDSLGLIKRLAQTDNRIKFKSNEEQRGAGFSRNIGLSLATGDYVTFQDGDDESKPNRIGIQLNALKSNPDIVLSLCNYVRVNDKGNTLEINNNRVMKCIISMMFDKKRVINEIGYFKSMKIGEDSDYYERIKIAFSKNSEKIIFRTLYRALFRQNSLFFSNQKIVNVTEKVVEYHPIHSFDLNQFEALRARRLMSEGKLSLYVDQDGNTPLPD